MRIIKVEYRKVEPRDDVDYMYNTSTMKFHLVVEIDGEKFQYMEYVPNCVPYKDLIKTAKRTFGEMIMDRLL